MLLLKKHANSQYFFILLILGITNVFASNLKSDKNSYQDLLTLSKDLRVLERPTLTNGVPDYTINTCAKNQITLNQYQLRLNAIDTTKWSLDQKVDLEIVRAEINAYDFNLRILQPWVRDPAFYGLIFTDQSDTPDHEGPTSFAAIELWQYAFPLSKDAVTKLTKQLAVIAPLLEQAQLNLTGNAHDLWQVGIGNIKDQIDDLNNLLKSVSPLNDRKLNNAITDAVQASNNFVLWLEKELPKKNGPSGIGKENYTWNLRHVLLIPLSWEEEVTILTRELNRAYSSLLLEREHNRTLAELKIISSSDEYVSQAEQSITKMMSFLKEKNILPVKDYFEPEIRKHLGAFRAEGKRNFFANIMHKEPNILYAHGTHWFEIAKLTKEPHPNPIRSGALPFNMWMTRSEGLATSMEETFMHAGLWDDKPRARELVWIMLAQRCARGLASLYAHANMIDYAQARAFQVEWTPAGWTGDVSLVGFEQHLYLRQPGYGSSYVTGKYQIERLFMDLNRQQGDSFKLYNFYDKLYGAGIIPLSLVRWQMTGLDDEIKSINETK